MLSPQVTHVALRVLAKGRTMPVARAIVVKHLPGNRAVAAIESEGEMTFLLAEDRPIQERAEQLTDLMQREVDSAMWTQHWGSPEGPPQAIAS
jgi:hypothetical protein